MEKSNDERERPAPRRAARPNLTEGFDPDFPRRVCRTSAVVAVLLAFLVGDRFGWRTGTGLLAGAGVSIAGLLAIDWMVRRFAAPEGPDGRKLGVVALLKLPLMAGALWLIVLWAGGNDRVLLAVLGGVTLVPAVIVLKILGAWLTMGPAAGNRNQKHG